MAACPQGAIQLTTDGIVPIDGVPCLRCGHCAEACPTTALEMCGREWTMEELMVEIEKERDIMADSGGGVTLCGGEPLLNAHATRDNGQKEKWPLVDLLKELGRRGFHRAVDTSLYVQDQDFLMQVVDECELMLVDLKLMDSEKHRRFTGVGNELILENLSWVIGSGYVEVWVRIPLIEGVNTDEENIEATAQFLSNIHLEPGGGTQGVTQVNLLPYHDLGQDKHRRMWSQYNPQQLPLATPSEEVLQRCVRQFSAHGIKAIVGG